MKVLLKRIGIQSIAILSICGVAPAADWIHNQAEYVLDALPGTDGLFGGSCGTPWAMWNNMVFLSGNDDVSGCELFVLGDLDEGPVLLADVALGTLGSSPSDITPCGDLVFFFASPSGIASKELWATDGTPEGTHLVADINQTGNSELAIPKCIDEKLYFYGNDGIHGREIWGSDGTGIGTSMLADVNPNGDSNPGSFTKHGNDIIFCADDGVVGKELHRLTPTPPLHELLVDFRAGPESGVPNSFVPFKNGLLCSAFIGNLTAELFFTDGTTAGTYLVSIINDVPQPMLVRGSSPGSITILGEIAVLAATNNALGTEPWRTDGTAEGTYILRDIDPRPFDLSNGTSVPGDFRRFGDHVFFTARDADRIRGLWYTDGSPEGTQLVPGIPSNATRKPDGFIEIHGFLYLRADDDLFRLNANHEVESLVTELPFGFSDNPQYIRGLLVFPGGSAFFGSEIAAININPWLVSFAPELAGPTDAQEVTFLMTFSEPVTGVDATDFEVVGPGLTGAFVSGAEALGDGLSWRVTVDTGLGDGTVSLRLVDDDSIVDTWALRWADDPAPPPLAPLDGFGTKDASTDSTGGTAIDKAAPTVLLSSPAAVIGTGSAVVTAAFERAVTGFTAEDVQLSNATLSDFAGEGVVYTFTLTPLAEGVFTAHIPFGAAMDGGNLENAPSNVLTLTLDPALLLHNADTNGDGKVSLSELLRVIQFYNTPGYHCNPANIEDGFEPGLTGDKTCDPHSSDYKPQNWLVSLSELLRSVQIYNIGNYRYCNDEQLEGDGYCVDAPPVG